MNPRLMFIMGLRVLVKLRVREIPAGENGGPMVKPIQEATGQKEGAPWCASFIAFVARVLETFGIDWPLPFTAGCDELLRAARKLGLIVELPVVGGLFLVMKSDDDAEHVGAIDKVFPDRSFASIEGNAADPKAPPTREGLGAFEGRIRHTVADTRRYVFIDPFKGVS